MSDPFTVATHINPGSEFAEDAEDAEPGEIDSFLPTEAERVSNRADEIDSSEQQSGQVAPERLRSNGSNLTALVLCGLLVGAVVFGTFSRAIPIQCRGEGVGRATPI